jgi:hypothetical protein
MKINLKKIFRIFTLTTAILLSTTSFAFAQTPDPKPVSRDYGVLSPLPGTTIGDCTKTDGSCKANLSTYLPGIFKLMIGVGAMAAFVVIIIGGFEVLLSDSLPIKMGGKKMIEDALWGLGLIIFSYAILYTINPVLLNGSLNIAPPTLPVATVSGGNVSNVLPGMASITNPCNDPSSAGCTKESTIATKLVADTAGAISLNSPCTPQSCRTQVGDLQQSTIDGIKAVQQKCACNIVISGGDEKNAPHSATGGHPNGTALDVLPNVAINSYLGSASPKEGDTKTLTINGKSVVAKYEVTGTNGTSTGNHWHIQF